MILITLSTHSKLATKTKTELINLIDPDKNHNAVCNLKDERTLEKERFIPAFNNRATQKTFNTLTTTRTSSPLLSLNKLSEKNIISVPYLLTFFTLITSMPHSLTLKTKQLLAIRALRFLHIPSTLIQHQSQAIPVGAIASFRP